MQTGEKDRSLKAAEEVWAELSDERKLKNIPFCIVPSAM